MRFSTVAALSTITLAGFSAACKSNADCPRGQTCQFLSTKDSQGRCYKRGEGPAAAGLGPRATKPTNIERNVVHKEALELIARDVVNGVMDEIVARSFDGFEDLD
ncbi:hypothetical protein C0991_010543 [Blastosporella zonata]|nr:hypothetical protein C0991_010543 [Blastosporella zonata]